MTDSDAMEEEFDTVPRWTAAAIEDLGPDHAVPAACRGSGNPAALSWLVEHLELERGATLLDVGAGMGGAAQFAVDAAHVDPTLVEPMVGACTTARRLFGWPVVAATGEQLPFRDNTFDAVWSLGVLCTSQDQPAMLRELRRMAKPGGRIGLLVFAAAIEQLPEQPEGNDFPTRSALEGLIEDAGLRVRARADLADFPSPSTDWQDRVDRVDDHVAHRHRHDDRWQTARTQEEIITRLITSRQVEGVVLVLQTR